MKKDFDLVERSGHRLSHRVDNEWLPLRMKARNAIASAFNSTMALVLGGAVGIGGASYAVANRAESTSKPTEISVSEISAEKLFDSIQAEYIKVIDLAPEDAERLFVLNEANLQELMNILGAETPGLTFNSEAHPGKAAKARQIFEQLKLVARKVQFENTANQMNAVFTHEAR